MKDWLTLMLALVAAQAGAGEFRFVHKETTGMCNFVRAKNDKETAIVITKDSEGDAVALLGALLEKQIYGTVGDQEHRGAKWEQGLILFGEFTSEVKRTPGGANVAAPENYRDFRVTGLKVVFPISRWAVAAEGNPLDGPMILETHFSFASLFPQGLAPRGKPIDLGRHAIGRGESK